MLCTNLSLQQKNAKACNEFVCFFTNDVANEKRGLVVQFWLSTRRQTDLGVSGTGLGVGVERLGLAISSPAEANTKNSLDAFVHERHFF